MIYSFDDETSVTIIDPNFEVITRDIADGQYYRIFLDGSSLASEITTEQPIKPWVFQDLNTRQLKTIRTQNGNVVVLFYEGSCNIDINIINDKLNNILYYFSDENTITQNAPFTMVAI